MEGLGEMSAPILGFPFGALDNPANSVGSRIVIFNA